MKAKIIILLAILTMLIGLKVMSKGVEERWEVVAGEKTYIVEVRDSDLERSKGLSGHKPLLDNQGMLFVFEKEGNYGIWMKEMLFSIDILWIDKDFKINHIEKEVKPETFPKVFYPNSDVLYVLEFASGELDKLKTKTGDYVKFIKK